MSDGRIPEFLSDEPSQKMARPEDYHRIPEAVKKGMDDWAAHGHRQGSFVMAVLRNDLFEALGRADQFSKAAMPAICGYVYNELPRDCWGSIEKIEEWAKSFVEKALTAGTPGKPKIFVFCNGCAPQWHNIVAVAEDGAVLGGHLCSDHCFIATDMGFTTTWKHDRYNAHYPGGWELELVPVTSNADLENHPGLSAALDLADVKRKERERTEKEQP